MSIKTQPFLSHMCTDLPEDGHLEGEVEQGQVVVRVQHMGPAGNQGLHHTMHHKSWSI